MRVAFYERFPFHEPILSPIRHALDKRVQCLASGDRHAVVRFSPDVLVTASSAHLEYFRWHLPATFTVNVGHGMISKRALGRLPARPASRTFDAVCVGDETRVATFERHRARPVEYWYTGYPQIDPLFRRDPPPILFPDNRRPTVLYAPTWNLGLTSATMLGEHLVDLVRGGAPHANVIIKPHPVIGDWRPRWMAQWARMATSVPGVHLVQDTHADVIPYMLASDILISDASSVIFEFLALDRPIVLITNPRHQADPAYDGADIVWRWRDVGHEVHDAKQLPAVLTEALREPDTRGERRRACAQQLFGRFTDGRNHARIAERIQAVGAGLEAGERLVPAQPRAPRLVWMLHDIRTAIGGHAAFRRHLLGPLEGVRLRMRTRLWHGGPSGAARPPLEI